MGKKLILVELNEINFDVVEKYIESCPSRFPALRSLITGPHIRSTSEQHYDKLEPWIQWTSVHSGLSYDEHKIFRLGDIVGSSVPQVFEQMEAAGVRVGCVSAMNAENRLKNPAYFIPDPWTRTPTDGSWWSQVLGCAVSQAVNDNARSRIHLKNIIYLAMGLLCFAQPKHFSTYWRLIRKSKGAPWRKALVLDLFLSDLHIRLFNGRRPNFSTVFLNAGAHIQHHYFLSAAPVGGSLELRNPRWYIPPGVDPVAEMLEVYDSIVGALLALEDVEVITATGLSQRPYDRVKYYYRLKDHAGFLKLLDIRFNAVYPRMTRDFLVEFSSEEDAKEAEARLAAARIIGDGSPLFGEIDNRGTSIFASLSYPNEITPDLNFHLEGKTYALAPHVAFVAIKNGMHQADGFAFFTPGVAKFAPPDRSHVKELYTTILQFFGVNGVRSKVGPVF